MSDIPLADHALLSDCGSAALVTTGGSVDWLCLTRFDSAPVFARILGDDAGHFRIAPVAPQSRARAAYRPSSLVLDTTWSVASGTLVVTDALALGARERGHDLGRRSPGVLLRHVRCTAGEVTVAVEYAPRPEFGLVRPRLLQEDGRLVADGGAMVVALSTELVMRLDGSTAYGEVVLQAGDDLTFALEQYDAWGEAPRRWKPTRVRSRLAQTQASWRSWSRLHQSYDGPLRDLVRHSGVVLQGLTYAPSGAMVAAATTSLPEGVGSGRTWDYRYTWVRDASMTLQGLYVAACPDEAGRFFGYLARAVATQLDDGRDLQIMFGIRGERDLTERVLPHLPGWRDSGPVRVGNGAWDQQQLDVYGAPGSN